MPPRTTRDARRDPCGSRFVGALRLHFPLCPQNGAVYMYSPQATDHRHGQQTHGTPAANPRPHQANRRAHGLSAHPRRNCPGAGFPLPNAAEDHLKALARKGAIELTAGASRGIRLKDAATAPAQAMLPHPPWPSCCCRWLAALPLAADPGGRACGARGRRRPGLFAQTPDYLLKVRGMSMRDAGILEGDLLAVKRATEARNGQIVVARLGDDVTSALAAPEWPPGTAAREPGFRPHRRGRRTGVRAGGHRCRADPHSGPALSTRHCGRPGLGQARLPQHRSLHRDRKPRHGGVLLAMRQGTTPGWPGTSMPLLSAPARLNAPCRRHGISIGAVVA